MTNLFANAGPAAHAAGPAGWLGGSNGIVSPASSLPPGIGGTRGKFHLMADSDTPPFHPDASEAALVARLRGGDARAFEELVRSQGGRMLAVARRLLGNDEDARDAVQEAFVAAFRSLDGFAGGARIATWLHRIVVNAALMRLRSRKRRPEESLDDLLPKFSEDGHAADPAVRWSVSGADAIAARERAAVVRAAIDRLPETYRTILLMRDIEEMDTQEAAEALGITENAAKIRLHRARQALRALLDPHFRGKAS